MYVIKFSFYSRLRHDEYNKIGAKIVDLFPKEALGTYYVPPIKKHDSLTGKSTLAKGKLVDKVRNLIHKCQEAVPKRKRKSGDCLDNKDACEPPSKKIAESSILENNSDVLWLQLNDEPWEEVLQKWKDTFIIRKNNINDTGGTLKNYIDNWPILKNVKSDILVIIKL